MEPEHRKEPHPSDRPPAERLTPETPRIALGLSFVNEGLEGVRDSHC